ncbi:RimK family alpha-L-glutamate ligase [bacterium]|nr:RimK family alpha-L-glutamate ligase [bacterium]
MDSSLPQLILLTRKPEAAATRRFLEAAGQRSGRFELHMLDAHELVLGLQDGALSVSHPRVAFPPGRTVFIPRMGSLATDFAVYALDVIRRCGYPLLNPPEALTPLRCKFNALAQLAAAGLPVPDSLLLRSPADLPAAAAALGGYPLVLKFIRGSQGVGVILANGPDAVDSVLSAMNVVNYDVMLQRYYPRAARESFRVLVIGGSARWAVRLSSNGESFRSNHHLGGGAEPAELSDELAELADRAAAAFSLGLAGIDIVHRDDGSAMVLEVNAAPGFETIESQHGVDAAGTILDYCAGLAG